MSLAGTHPGASETGVWYDIGKHPPAVLVEIDIEDCPIYSSFHIQLQAHGRDVPAVSGQVELQIDVALRQHACPGLLVWVAAHLVLRQSAGQLAAPVFCHHTPSAFLAGRHKHFYAVASMCLRLIVCHVAAQLYAVGFHRHRRPLILQAVAAAHQRVAGPLPTVDCPFPLASWQRSGGIAYGECRRHRGCHDAIGEKLSCEIVVKT